MADWQVLAAYPLTSLVQDGGRQRLRWFLKVNRGGDIEDLLTGTRSSGLFVELLYDILSLGLSPAYAHYHHRPVSKERPSAPPTPGDPFIPGRRPAMGELLN